MDIHSDDSADFLTGKQKLVLEFIEDRYCETGSSPTYEEIAKQFKWNSVNSVTNHVSALREKGYLSLTGGKNRQLTPIRVQRKLSHVTNTIPLLGSIAAGLPIEAIESADTMLDLGSFGVTNERGDKFALRVKGNSMINRGIQNGDIVVVQRQSFVTRRDVAAVRIGSDVTLKYVKQEADCIKLIPDNDFMSPIVVNPREDFEIFGKVIKLFRDEV